MKKQEIEKYLKRTDLTIEGNTAIWNISSSGIIQGTYTGAFRFKCYLTPTEKLAAGREYRELLGPSASSAFRNEDNLAFSLSQLKYRIISAPPFWSSATGINGLQGDIPDESIIDVVLEAAGAAELKFLAQLHKNKEKTIKKAKEVAEQLLEHKEGKEETEEGDEN